MRFLALLMTATIVPGGFVLLIALFLRHFASFRETNDLAFEFHR